MCNGCVKSPWDTYYRKYQSVEMFSFPCVTLSKWYSVMALIRIFFLSYLKKGMPQSDIGSSRGQKIIWMNLP